MLNEDAGRVGTVVFGYEDFACWMDNIRLRSLGFVALFDSYTDSWTSRKGTSTAVYMLWIAQMYQCPQLEVWCSHYVARPWTRVRSLIKTMLPEGMSILRAHQ